MEVAVDEIVEQLSRKVAMRRQNGDYPFGLEAELEAEFDGVLAAMRRRELSTVELWKRVDSMRSSVDQISGTTATSSSIPGGALAHKATGRLVGRHTNGLAASVRSAGHEAVAALVEVISLLESQQSADDRQLTEVVAAVIDRLAVVDQMVSAINEIERRLDALEAATVDGS